MKFFSTTDDETAIMIKALTTGAIVRLREVPSPAAQPPVSTVLAALSRLMPVHSSAFQTLRVTDRSYILGNIKRLTPVMDQLTPEAAQWALFGTNDEMSAALRASFQLVHLTLKGTDGAVVESPVIVAKDFKFGNATTGRFLIDGELKNLELAEIKEGGAVESFRPAAGDAALLNTSLKGISGSPGYGLGQAFIFFDWDKGACVKKYAIAPEEIEREVARFAAAVGAAGDEIGEELAGKIGVLRDVLESHRMLLGDDELNGAVCREIRGQRLNAEHVLAEVANGLVQQLRKARTQTMRSREYDIEDIARRLQKFLAQSDDSPVSFQSPKEDIVIVASRLLPSDAASLYHIRDRVKGIVTEEGAPTAHTAIIARGLGIPAVMGVKNATTLIRDGDRVGLYGIEGTVNVNPSSEVCRDLQERIKVAAAMTQKISAAVAGKKTQTLEGQRVVVLANVGTSLEEPMAYHQGAEGIGLYRTENIYFNRRELPTEDEQTDIYAQLAGPVKLRTFDLGGDKVLPPYMPFIPVEMTSFLGLRGARLYFHDEWWTNCFRTHVRAILRASAYNKALEIMFPMISRVSEFIQTRKFVERTMAEMRGKVEFNEKIRIGTMVEVPSAVIISDELARAADFLSIGSNDLLQYTLGVDRENSGVAHLYDPSHRSILWSVRRVINEAKRAEKPVGLCGEIAADPVGALLMVGLGINYLSMPAAAVPAIKYMIGETSLPELQELAQSALEIRSEEMLATPGRERILRLAEEKLSLRGSSALSFLEEMTRPQPIG
jgi:phosphoenolpyruvate-protein phosphotransferase (PTS system enzyme I)